MTCWMAREGARAGEQVLLLTVEERSQPLSGTGLAVLALENEAGFSLTQGPHSLCIFV